jgi:hypothetical protein
MKGRPTFFCGEVMLDPGLGFVQALPCLHCGKPAIGTDDFILCPECCILSSDHFALDDPASCVHCGAPRPAGALSHWR